MFYTSTCYHLLKEPPLASHEPLGTITTVYPKVWSRRYPCKVVKMDIIAPTLYGKKL